MTDEHQPPVSHTHGGIRGGLLHVQFNPDDFRHHLEGSDLTPEQQDELLRILFDIMRQFVDWGFNLHPVQTAQSHGKPGCDVVALLEHWAKEAEQEEAE